VATSRQGCLRRRIARRAGACAAEPGAAGRVVVSPGSAGVDEQERFSVSLAYRRLDVWSLMDVYRATFDIVCEANLQLPFAIAEAWGLTTRG
jgi:hypothetical protein